MKYFVTGGTGFIGSHLINHLLMNGHEVVAVHRTHTNTRVPLAEQPTWLRRELSGITATDLLGCDAVINLASAGMPNNPEKVSFRQMFFYNIDCLLNLMSAARDAGVKKQILCSTFKEYGKSAGMYDFIPTTAPLMPTTAFSCSRASAFMAAQAFCHTFPVDVEYIRFFNVYGEGENELDLWTALKRAAQAGRDFDMTGGEQVRDYIHVDKVVRKIEAISTSPQSPGLKVSHVASGEPIRLRDFAEHWWKEWGATGQLRLGALPYRHYESMRIVAAI